MASDLLPCVSALLHSQVLFSPLLEKNKADSLARQTVDMLEETDREEMLDIFQVLILQPFLLKSEFRLMKVYKQQDG